jgi:sulfopyruvate decarboxylase subunit beta
MRRDHAIEVLRDHVRPDDIVVAVYQSCFDWLALAEHDLTYVATGAMGQASSHALGLALACPDRRVLVFDGDGSLLMNLGALVTIAGAAPQNLHHFVFANGIYEVNGAQPLPAKVDFAAMAHAAGYARAEAHGDLDAFRAYLPQTLTAEGPSLTELQVVKGADYPWRYDYIHSSEARDRFAAALRRDTP